MSRRGELLVEQHRRQQVRIHRLFVREFIALWDALSWRDLDGTFAGWARAVMRILREWRQESAEAAITHHTKLRLAEAPEVSTPIPPVVFVERGSITLAHDAGRGLTTREQTQLAEIQTRPQFERAARQVENRPVRLDYDDVRPVVLDWSKADEAAETSLIVTGPVELKRRSGAGQPERQAKREALVLASGAASRHVLNGGRTAGLELVQADKAALGWARVTGSSATGPCAFCVMLASRGGDYRAYRTRAAAAFSAHDNCRCTAVAIYNRDDYPGRAQQREWFDLWQEVTKGYSGQDARNAFRRHWERIQREQRQSVAA